MPVVGLIDAIVLDLIILAYIIMDLNIRHKSIINVASLREFGVYFKNKLCG